MASTLGGTIRPGDPRVCEAVTVTDSDVMGIPMTMTNLKHRRCVIANNSVADSSAKFEEKTGLDSCQWLVVGCWIVNKCGVGKGQ